MKEKRKPSVLIADDQPEVRELLARKLQERGKQVREFASGALLVKQLSQAQEEVELVVLDMDFGQGEPGGIEILRQLKQRWPDLPVIILTGKGSVDAAVQAIQGGAADFIEKDLYVEDKLELGMEKVERMLQVLRDNARLRAENVFYRGELGQRYRIVSRSPRIQAILEQVERLASIPRPVLIQGERGTGKELIAAALHYGSDRRERPFVKLNCAALSDTLLESELFGHEKGAFTGATELRRGRFESADGGTLFLDEVGNTSLEFQKNVLRVIEYQEFERIGSARTLKVDVRVVAATNADLDQEIAAGRFRADLYDRLRFSVVGVSSCRSGPRTSAPWPSSSPGSCATRCPPSPCGPSARRPWRPWRATPGRAMCASSSSRWSAPCAWPGAGRWSRRICRPKCGEPARQPPGRAISTSKSNAWSGACCSRPWSRPGAVRSRRPRPSA